MKLVNKIKKKFKKLNNSGSSIVLVVVALAFIGIIIGALLSAAMYGFRQKLQDLNSKNNFYNVEQAMNEIYAGVGINTIEEMQKAYTYTLTNMVYFDTDKGTYSSLSDDSANILFKNSFMKNLSGSAYFTNELALANALQSYITNDTVFLDKEKVSVVRLDANGNVIPLTDTENLDKIVIKNVTLTRTQEYNNAAGEGTYTQTVSADIEIVKPEFRVNFNKTVGKYPAIFDYAFVGDSGIEVSKFSDDSHYANPAYDVNSILSIKGNIYGASDYYNHKYNDELSVVDPADSLGLKIEACGTSGVKISKTVAAVEDGTPQDLWYNFVNVSSKGAIADYDGEKERSMFSGLYIDNANVSIMADQLVVPGCISVMNESDVTVFSGKTTKAEVWADDIVLGGESNVINKTGSSAYFNADLYIRDDTEINANHSTFAINGSYYGYGDSTSKDTREFVSTVTASKFTTEGSTTSLRDHYNSSAIIVNGENDSINLANANALYLAGRAYIQLSKKVTHNNDKTTGVASDTYTFNPASVTVNADGTTNTDFIRDYQTAESISVKPNQLMYEVSDIGTPVVYELGGKEVLSVGFATLDEKVVRFFDTFFPILIFEDRIPCVSQKVGAAVVNYIDFDTAYNLMSAAGDSTYSSVDAYKRAFVNAYSAAMNKDYDALVGILNLSEVLPANAAGQVGTADALAYATELKEALTNVMSDVSANDGKLESIKYGTGTNIYSSGAITTKVGSSVRFITDKKNDDTLKMLLGGKYSEGTVSATIINDDIERQYLLRKWTLNPASTVIDVEEETYIKNVVSVYGESAVTPINYYMLMNNIPNNGSTIEFAANGGHVWMSGGDVFIDGKTKITDEAGNLVTINPDFTGVIVAKGDVTLGYGINTFKGTIIAGGKVYVDKSLKILSTGAVECKSIIDDCLAHKNKTNEDGTINYKRKLLDLFRMYSEVLEAYDKSVEEGAEAPEEIPEEASYYDKVNIEAIDYSDVVSLANWQRSVGGGTDDTP